MTLKRKIHVVLLTLLTFSFQGCSSAENSEKEQVSQTLKLSTAKTTLAKDANTTVTVIDANGTDVTETVQWIITPQDALHITHNNLKAVKDGNITLQAKLGSTTSNILHVNVFWEVNGYRLPPMPDEKLNNSTLLGIDVNNNGVRDDVERWIYTSYEKPIEHAVFMQSSRAYQKVIVEPEKALENVHHINNMVECISYYKRWADNFGDKVLIDRYRNLEEEIAPTQFNTANRFLAYKKFNEALSGGVYELSKPVDKKSKCDFNTSLFIETE